MLPWILFLLGTTDIATERIKTWIGDRLDEIGNEFGVHQSLVLADRLKSGNIDFAWYRDPWRTPAGPTPGDVTPQTPVDAEIGEMDLG